jgi:putative ABC transport system permease protein
MTRDPLPRLARWLLAAVVPAPWRDSIEGDLAEERAHRRSRGRAASVLWTVAAAASIATRLVLERLTSRIAAPRKATRRVAMDRFVVDIQHAVRGLARNRGFTATAVLTLALGIGANAAVFTATWHLLLKPLPWPAADRLVQVWNTVRRTGDINVLAPANYLDIEREAQSFEAVAAYTFFDYPLNVTGAGDPIEARVRAVTGGYFRVFATPPALGRTLTTRDAEADARVMVISEGLWDRQFGRTPEIVGRTVELDDRRYEVVGVMPASFDPSARPLDGWVPYHFTSELAERRLGYFLGAVARLGPDVTVAQANAEVSAIATRAGERYPSSNQNIGATARSLRDELTGSLRGGLLLLVGCAAMVLLIACSNLTSLQVARTGGVGREIAIRAALGATRGQVIRLLLVEAGLVAIAAGAAGLVAGLWIVQTIAAVAPPTLGIANAWTLDPGVAAATLAISLASGLIVALIAALPATRAQGADALRSRSASDRGGQVRSALVTTQVAMATSLMVIALALLVSFAALLRVEMGFNPSGVVAADVRLPTSRYPTPELRAQFFETAMMRLGAERGVTGTCATNTVPLEQAGTMTYVPDGSETLVSALPIVATPGCFATLGITLRSGRLFQTREPEPVAIVSEGYARRAFPGQSPLGKIIRVGLPTGDRLLVIGVVADSRRVSLERESFGQVYQPVQQSTYFAPSRLLVRTTAPIDVTATAIRRVVSETDRLQPIANIRALDDVVTRSLGSRRFNLFLLGGFASIALLLSSIGVYGLLAQLVAGRRPEIGVRIVLGAKPNAIARLITSSAIRSVGIGVLLGLTGAALGSRAIAQFVYGISPTEPFLYVAAAVLLIAVACLAALVPVRRALRVDPIKVLRAD